MTKARRGPSLIQARSPPGNKNHNHFHSLQRRSINTNPHINSNNDGSEPHHQHHQHHNRQAPDAAPTPAADSALVTHVVQTVSVIQIVDGNGVPVRVQTQFAEPATVVVDPVAGVTVDYSVYQAAGGIPTAQPEPPATPAPGEVQPGSAPKPAAEPACRSSTGPSDGFSSFTPETNPPPETRASAMVQRSLGLGSAALAGLGAKRASRQASEQPEEAGERGFYRVSGRKLPPVLQAGGDGYTDPRMSVVSNDESVYYRQSTTFFDDPASGSTAPRLALGSPMRPVSGVPIMRSGPARTPVQESNPFADPAPPSHLMVPPLRDAVGRSLTSQDGSRGSVSRFTEEIR
ncbi:conserved hypothetical protein [Verticillium alfalfae VaMs.102]|uniref:Uncharacterized protein n=1 Tax=Verticillium alfalfae (strain VaMs.102 / ATCC MYA-4576 / FGSC 10136) TaxID=526221 RepID=C9S529_VERA1|nr:conserved hypothetical protein [Verticillium alfalfae VaMs.102]EEY14129.1 conserved hypothetical protein [Verticillium alfalfae VaMs.102]